MSDLKLRWGTQGADLELDAGDLVVDESLVTGVLVSLFSDGLAPEDPAIAVLEQDRRGWWADFVGDPYGSRLWQLERAKALPETFAAAEEYVRAGLAWLLEEEIAKRIDVSAEVQGDAGSRRLLLDVTIVRGTAKRWAHLWRGTRDVSVVAGDAFLTLTFP